MRFPIVASIALMLVLSACSSPDSREGGAPSNGEEVIRAMHEAYDGDWYETLTFVQTTINHGPGGAVDTMLWYEAMKLPGRLRIDISEPGAGDTWIFRNDSIYVYARGQLAQATPTIHPLLLLGFDVYHLPAEQVIAKLDTLGFDLAAMYETEWNGRGVYAIGADSAGTDAPQFWIDRERLVFVRLFQNAGPGGAIRQDIRFDAYEPLGDAWIAPDVKFLADSTLMLEERYSDIEIGMMLDDSLFEPGSWQEAGHWVQADTLIP